VSGGLRRTGRWLTAVWLLLAVNRAGAEEPAALARLRAREETLAQQQRASGELARQQARVAYRLARKRQLEFVAMPEARLEDARALDLALLTVARSANETRILGAEVARARDERQALATATARQAPGADDDQPRFQRPVRGAIVGHAGLRRDPVTDVEVRQDALLMLARMNEDVHAPADGVVQRIEAQPQGGYALVLAHPGGWTSVLGGLREVSVEIGDKIEGGAPVALAGRNLDGAVVVSLELWRGRSAVDPEPLVKRRR
jgi:murein DD-endopeptidase MepM/ murein hydrolase activator NlpD